MKNWRLAFTLCFVGMLVVWTWQTDAAKRADKPHPKENVPALARILGVRVGVDTIEKLEELLGPGAPCMGGHPHGGRIWKIKPTGWYIYADGFEYSDDGRIIDGIGISKKPMSDFSSETPKPRVPVITLARNRLGCIGGIVLGESIESVKRKLAELPKPTSRKGSLVWTARGQHYVNRDTSYKLWEMDVDFERGKVSAIGIDAASTTYRLWEYK
jgi:hypothetical protein